MPELPEVESVRRALESLVVGLRVARVRVSRRDVIEGAGSAERLLQGATIGAVARHGKQLAIVGEGDGPALCVHLGMTGQLVRVDEPRNNAGLDHVHVVWTLRDKRGDEAGELLFRDPRRFGGIWTFESFAALRAERWSTLGPDATTIESAEDPRLGRLWSSGRPIKNALLDQSVLAGVGNIYADESLFTARVHPGRAARTLGANERAALVQGLRSVLGEAIDAGGSTLRDYVLPSGDPGSFQFRHRVYGRGGLPCPCCGHALCKGLYAQRTTVWCGRCQPSPNAQ